MKKIRRYFILGILLLPFLGFCSPGNDGSSAISGPDDDPSNHLDKGIVWHWEQTFNKDTREKVEKWVLQVHHATQELLGTYPFEVHYHIYERADSYEPVPWAHTWRYPEQSVHFYIDPDYSYASFMGDWTAPHEISHLSIPYIGERNSWFAEGYASFLQYQVMHAMGIYTETEVQEKYRKKINNVRSFYQSDNDMVSIARNLKEGNSYAPMYWGGATYFITLNNILIEKHNSSLSEVIKEYQSCCRLKDHSLKSVIASWDKIIGAPLASSLLYDYENDSARDTFARCGL